MILVTGGSGFLGSNITRKLLHEHHSVVLLNRSHSNMARLKGVASQFQSYAIDTTSLETVFKNHKISTILHCAVNYGRDGGPVTELIEANIAFPTRLLELAARNGVHRFINIDTVLDKRINSYSLSKRHFQEWMETYSRQLNCVNVAVEHFYGPDDDPSKFVTRTIQQILRKDKAIALTAGIQKRDFVYIDDVVEAFSRIVNDRSANRSGYFHYELGSGINISIRDFVTLIKEITKNTETELIFGATSYRDHELMESKIDLSMISLLGYSPQVSIEVGLARTIDFEKKKMGI